VRWQRPLLRGVHSITAMAKLKTDPITQADLAAFAANDSDFAFELRVLRQLRGLGFQCEHSGTYEDPVTGKFRQFDIRANKNFGNVQLAMAVECKNIRPYHPLLVSAVPRTEAEAFHNRIEFTATGPNASVYLALTPRIQSERVLAKRLTKWDAKTR
jgi:hypothetical protein